MFDAGSEHPPHDECYVVREYFVTELHDMIPRVRVLFGEKYKDRKTCQCGDCDGAQPRR